MLQVMMTGSSRLTGGSGGVTWKVGSATPYSDGSAAAPSSRGRISEASCLDHHMGAHGRTVSVVIGRIASAQYGVVARAQLLEAGITPREIARRLGSGVLLAEFRGVYRVGHRAASVEARYMAAVLACGEGAVLSGLAAGHLLGVLKGRPPPPAVT